MFSNTLEEYSRKYSIIDYDRFRWMRENAPQGNKIVDIGCCYGAVFSGYDRSKITSVDLDDYSHLLPNFIKANAMDLPFSDNEFDISVIGEVLEHQTTINEAKKVLSEAVRVAKKTIFTVPNEYLWFGDSEKEKFKDYSEILKENNNDLEYIAKKFAPFAKSWHFNNGLTHVNHHLHYSPKDLEDLIESVTYKDYMLFILKNDGNHSTGMVGTTAGIIQ